MGLAQLERLEELIERKRSIFGWYADRLSGVADLKLNAEPAGTRNSYWMVTVILDPRRGIDKQAVAARLDHEGIDTRPFFHPLSSQPAYRDHDQARIARGRNRAAYALGPWGLNLPSALMLTEESVDRVVRVLRQAISA
jgi:perosamine synthetase